MAGRQSKLMSVIRVSSGNFLEMYDFTVFAYYATAIGHTYFPAGEGGHGEFVSLMLSLMTFGAGFLMRPLGALVLGAYIDQHGRRAGLLLTLGLMSVGTLAIAVVPGYASIGLAAPLLVVVSRLIQGFSAGVELGGVSVYLSEIATPGHKGFYVSWQSGSQQVAVVFAAALGVLLPRVLADHATRYGDVPGGGLAVVLLGKAGGREMMAGSDLDMLLVYDHAPDVAESDGPRRLPVSQYYIRAAHAVVAALTAPGADGALYAVDMRLRPSGNKGPVAVSLASFRHYHAAEAWTWERMALTRARVVAGPPALCHALEAAITEAIASADPARVRPDATAMRVRTLHELPPHGAWDVKLMPGGQVEVEFIVQTALLLHPAALPAQTIRTAIARLGTLGALDAAEQAALTAADRVWRTVQGLLRITMGPRPPEALPEALLAITGDGDEAAFRARMQAMAAQVRSVFEARVGAVG